MSQANVLCRRSRDASKPQFISEFSVKASKRDTGSWRTLPSASSSDRAETKRSVLSLPLAGGLCLLMLPATVLLQHTVGSKDVATADQVSITSVVVTCWPPRFLWDYFWFIKTDSSWCLKAQCSTVHCSCVRPLWCLTQRQTTPCIPLVDGRFFPWSW